MQLTSGILLEEQKIVRCEQGDSLIEKVECIRCTFSHCNFSSSTFSKSVFESCVFLNCDFSNVKCKNTSLVDCEFKNCRLIGIDWTKVRTTLGLVLKCSECDLSYSYFAQMKLEHSAFKKSKLEEADFTESNCELCDFSESNLLRAVFYKTNLKKTNFVGATDIAIHPGINRMKGAKFSHGAAQSLLDSFGIEFVSEE